MRNRPQITFLSLLLLIFLAGCGNDESTSRTPTERSSEDIVTPTSVIESIPAGEGTIQTTDNETAPPATTIVGPATSIVVVASAEPGSGVTPFPVPTRGAGGIYDSNNDGSLDWEEYQLAIRDMVAAFPWPAPYTVTPEQIIALWPEENHSAQFQVGFERDNVSAFWECAWLMTWLDSRNGVDPELEAQATEYIVNTFPNFVEDDYSRIPINAMIDQVLLGDPTAVINFVNVNCSGMNLQRVSTP